MLSLLFALAVAQSASHPVRWVDEVAPPGRPALVARLAQPMKGTPAPLVENTRDGTTEIRTCTEYAAAKKRRWEPENNTQIAVESFFREQCEVGALILAAKPSRESFVDRFAFDGLALESLPPTLSYVLSPDEERAADEAERRGQSWKAFQPAARIVGTLRASQIDIEVPDEARIRLTIKAFGDFDGDGVEDVLVFVSTHAIGASFQSYEPIVLTRTSAGGSLRAVKIKRP